MNARITVYGYYRGDRLYASAVNEETADFVADKVAGMEFIDEHVDKNGHAEYVENILIAHHNTQTHTKKKSDTYSELPEMRRSIFSYFVTRSWMS